MSDFASPDAAQARRRAYWLKTLHQWHWISAAACLMAMLGFSITGITLNHAGQIGATPMVQTLEAQVPEALLPAADAVAEGDKQPLPVELREWIAQQVDVNVGGRQAEWSEAEIYVSLPRPGGDGWLSIDRETGELMYEVTDRGWLSYFNDLHKGRNTGTVWAWFIDIFAIACIVFTLTGLVLLQMHARKRPATWPMVGFGLVLPVILALIFIH